MAKKKETAKKQSIINYLDINFLHLFYRSINPEEQQQPNTHSAWLRENRWHRDGHTVHLRKEVAI